LARRRRESRSEVADEELRLGRAHGQEHQVGVRLGHQGFDARELRRLLLESEGRAVDAGDDEAGAFPLQYGDGLLGGAGVAAQEEDAASAARGSGGEGADEVRARDPLRQRRALQAAGPDQRRAVGHAQVGFGGRGAEGLVAAQHAQVVQVDGVDPPAAARLPGLLHVTDDLLLGQGVQRRTGQHDLGQVAVD
jgi:hypothetical protein